MQKMRSTPGSVPKYNYRKSLKKVGQDISSRWVWVNRYLNRPLASLLVKVLLPTRITPNQVSAAAFLLGMAGAGLFFLGRHIAFALGGLLVQLSSIVDCADGMLARSRGESSPYGQYLDLFLDRLFEFFLLIGTSVGVYRMTGDVRLLLVGFLACALYFLEISLFNIILRYMNPDHGGSTSELRALFLMLVMVIAFLNRLDIGLFLFLGVSTVINLAMIRFFLRIGKKNRKTLQEEWRIGGNG